MQTVLKEKFWAFIVQNNPELVLSLQSEYSLTTYIDEKVEGIMPKAERLIAEGTPVYLAEEMCLDELTTELRPSKFLYIKAVLEEEFPQDYIRLNELGVLTYEIVNMIDLCLDVFESFNFSIENQDGRHLQYAIIASIHDYLT